jgi:DNA-binding beta-propeller fold protein YncE
MLNDLLRHRSKKVAHFALPYGVAVDGAGNLYVTNAAVNSVSIVSADYKFSPTTITQGVSVPIGVAADTNGNVYVANATGGVNKFNSSFAPVQTFTANASAPVGIAVDQAQDLWIVTDTGELAVDDAYGNSIWSAIFGGSPLLESVAIGAPNVYAFYDGAAAFGNISVGLRQNSLQYIDGPLSSAEPYGAACAQTQSLCWTTDALNDTLSVATLPGSGFSTSLGYEPIGVAVDTLRNRVYVADPLNNAVHVYNASTLAFEKTLT